MVAFASFFLGLVVGIQTVELRVGEPVASVDVLIDGRHAGRLEQEPWSLPLDFGEELVPHELVAVAHGEGGQEVGRTSQWVNLPRSPAEASIVLERDGEEIFARLDWESVVGTEPLSVKVSLDGTALTVTDVRRVKLPEHDPEQLHFLRVELEFARNISSVSEMTFGGSYAGDTRSELTAVAVELDSGAKLPPIRNLQGRFRKAGKSLTVVATEEGPATVLVVRDERARDTLAGLGRSNEAARMRRRRTRFGGGPPSDPLSLRYMLPLVADQQLRFLWPKANTRGNARRELEVFDFSSPFGSKDGGLYWLLSNVLQPPSLSGEQRLTEAVAVAGVVAARRNRRRVVVLVLNEDTLDPSRFQAPLVRRYLEALMVPLVVWSPKPGAGGTTPWGETRDISSLSKLDKAVEDLNRGLDRQRLVWVEGLHLPQDITLDGELEMRIVR
jgi:hypothetical protein